MRAFRVREFPCKRCHTDVFDQPEESTEYNKIARNDCVKTT